MQEYQGKLKAGLIEVGKEVEKIKNTPTEEQLELTLKNLSFAIQQNDMSDMYLFCRKLAAQALRFMVDEL